MIIIFKYKHFANIHLWQKPKPIPNLFKAADTTTKMLKIKAKATNYLKSMAIPGIRQIVTTKSYLFKVIWTILILISLGFGIQNISLATYNYYQFDVITNIKRVTLENVTFPAITFCHWGSYKRDHYFNGTLFRSDNISIKTDNVSRIRKFFDNTLSKNYFYSKELDKVLNISDHVEYFKIPDEFDCVRFNGFVANKKIQLFQANTSDDFSQVLISNNYIEIVSGNEYYNFSFNSRYSGFPAHFYVYITNKYLRSFEKVNYLWLDINKAYDIEIEKESFGVELSEPYNQCKESPIEYYHQWNCIEACIYREIKNKYNCTYPLSLFAIPGSRQCNITGQSMNKFQQEFLARCNRECPESCYSEKFGHYITTTQTIERSGKGGVYTQLRFSFRDFSSLNITQIPKIDVYTFINNIGGGVGLFMGIAFPTLIEFIQFVFETFSIAFFEGNIL